MCLFSDLILWSALLAGTSSAKAQEAGSPASAKQAQHAASLAGVETAPEAAAPAAAEADEQAAAEPAAVLPGRVPLLCKGMTSEQYAALQHRRANKGPRKALAFQYPPGRHIAPICICCKCELHLQTQYNTFRLTWTVYSASARKPHQA